MRRRDFTSGGRGRHSLRHSRVQSLSARGAQERARGGLLP